MPVLEGAILAAACDFADAEERSREQQSLMMRSACANVDSKYLLHDKHALNGINGLNIWQNLSSS